MDPQFFRKYLDILNETPIAPPIAPTPTPTTTPTTPVKPAITATAIKTPATRTYAGVAPGTPGFDEFINHASNTKYLKYGTQGHPSMSNSRIIDDAGAAEIASRERAEDEMIAKAGANPTQWRAAADELNSRKEMLNVTAKPD